jgi:two-component system, LytTR family, response regulator
MLGISGLDLLRSLRKEQARRIVFLTAHKEYALDAFNVEALDYILKPIDEARFAACIERAMRMLSFHRQEATLERLLWSSNDHRQTGQRACDQAFPGRRGNEFTFVQVGDVDWIEGRRLCWIARWQ